MVEGDPRALLTETQMVCLRQARTKLTNKNIALAMGISPFTVAQHLKEARLRLGDISRAEAVERVYLWDHAHPQKTTSATRDVALAGDPAMVEAPPANAGVPATEIANAVREERVQFDATPIPLKPSLRRLVAYWLKSFSAELSAAQRARWMVGFMLALALGVLVMVAVGESVQRTLHSLGY